MPTITAAGRPSIGGPSDTVRPTRFSVTAPTGMDLPSLKAQEKDPADPAQQAKPGQSGIAEETAPAPAVTLSPQLTALARKQQQLQREQQAFKEQQAAFQAKEADYVPKSTFKAQLQADPAAALEALGTNYEELTALLLAQQQGSDPVQASVKTLEEKLARMEASQEENVSKQYEATLKQYRQEADSLVAADPKAHFLISKGNHQDVVVQHILETWKEDGTVMTVEDAAKEVEEFLRTEAREKKALLEELEGPPPEVKAEKVLPPPAKSASRTLTNSVETTPKRTYNQFQHMTPRERLEAAIARSNK